MAGRVILIVGFPGSGKTTYGVALKFRLGAKEYTDDYHKGAIGGNGAFDHGRDYQALIAGLQRGETWLASDREWCLPLKRRSVESAIRTALPDVTIEWHFLSTSSDDCRRGIIERARPSVNEELRKLEELAKYHHIPHGSTIVEVPPHDAR
ncbi:MAG TPA: hypothetical protein VFG68_07775 [Fimbriiglobus sp.]|nr:hypothetical protein [Fimbriiglobus sp.]